MTGTFVMIKDWKILKFYLNPRKVLSILEDVLSGTVLVSLTDALENAGLINALVSYYKRESI